jgi:metallo-beta-lactamase class B
LLIVAGAAVFAQAPSAKPDSPKIAAEIERIKGLAGAEWAPTEKYFCETDGANPSPNAPLIEPAKLFDNLYVLGRQGTATYVISTSEGLILIDAGYAGQTEDVLLAGMKKLDLNPKQVRYVLLAHGHADHFGGARYLQEHLDAHVFLGAADWDLVLQPAAGEGKANAPTPPRRDLTIGQGMNIVLGDTSITPISIPGHTPGSMGFVFEVRDGEETHIAGLFGGTALITSNFTKERLQQYLGSLDKWARDTKKMNVDVEIQNHPVMDGMAERLMKLRARKASDPNPFVVGADSYQRFLKVMSDCIRVRIARAAE